MSMILKIKLFVLSLVFPLSFLLAGYLIGENSYLLGFEFKNTGVTIILCVIGFLIGIVFNIICYYRKVFAIAIYQTPIPLTLFFSFWWITNSFVNEWIAISLGFLGLFLGLWLNSVLVLPYQFFKIIILGLFMGVPIFNILLGVFAGNYLAMRIISYIKDEKDIGKSIHQGASFSALVILIISILAGLMAFVDIETYLQTFTSLTHIPINGEKFLLILVIAGIIGVLLQYLITRFTAYTMLHFHNYKKFSGTQGHS